MSRFNDISVNNDCHIHNVSNFFSSPGVKGFARIAHLKTDIAMSAHRLFKSLLDADSSIFYFLVEAAQSFETNIA